MTFAACSSCLDTSALVPVNGDEWMRDATGAEVVATWPAIVERQLWEDCRAVLAARATGVGVPRRRSWLTGRLTCGACGDRDDSLVERQASYLAVLGRRSRGLRQVSRSAQPHLKP